MSLGRGACWSTPLRSQGGRSGVPGERPEPDAGAAHRLRMGCSTWSCFSEPESSRSWAATGVPLCNVSRPPTRLPKPPPGAADATHSDSSQRTTSVAPIIGETSAWPPMMALRAPISTNVVVRCEGSTPAMCGPVLRPRGVWTPEGPDKSKAGKLGLQNKRSLTGAWAKNACAARGTPALNPPHGCARLRNQTFQTPGLFQNHPGGGKRQVLKLRSLDFPVLGRWPGRLPKAQTPTATVRSRDGAGVERPHPPRNRARCSQRAHSQVDAARATSITE